MNNWLWSGSSEFPPLEVTSILLLDRVKNNSPLGMKFSAEEPETKSKQSLKLTKMYRYIHSIDTLHYVLRSKKQKCYTVLKHNTDSFQQQ